MAEFKPTPSQKLAIEDRGGELLVSAAAGAADRVLTERLMRWITEGDAPRSIDNFLIITFSTAAAAELRSRISEELSARAAADPGSKRLRRESALVRRAQIGTIHSFCSALLREYAGPRGHRAGLRHSGRGPRAGAAPPLAGDGAGGGLRRGGAGLHPARGHRGRRHGRPGGSNRWCWSCTASCNPTPGRGTGPRGSRSSSRPARRTRRTRHGAASCWRARRTSCFGGPGSSTRLVRSLAGFEKMGKAYVPSFSETASSLRGAAKRAAEGWDALREALPIAFPRLGSLRGGGEDPELAERAKARREACKKAAKRIEKGFTLPSEPAPA